MFFLINRCVLHSRSATPHSKHCTSDMRLSCYFVIYIFVPFFLFGCTIDGHSISNFDLTPIQEVPIGPCIHPQKLDCDVPLYGFVIEGGYIVSNLLQQPHFLAVSGVQSGQIDAFFCRRGRGPGEFVTIMPKLSKNLKGDIFLYDASRNLLRTLDLQESLKHNTEIYSSELSINGTTGDVMTLTSFHQYDRNNIAAFDASNGLNGEPAKTPCYLIINSFSGQVVDSICCYKSLHSHKRSSNPLFSMNSLYSQSSCANPEVGRLFVAMARFPQVNIIDFSGSRVFGKYLPSASKQSYSRANAYFTSVCSNSEYIYCLYYGDRQKYMLKDESEMDKPVTSSLFVFSWDGSLVARSPMDDIYTTCQIDEEYIYFSKEKMTGACLYKYPLKDICAIGI